MKPPGCQSVEDSITIARCLALSLSRRQLKRVISLKASQSLVDVFVNTPLEILENPAKLNWSKIAKGALQVRKRKAVLMELEMRAPGRECDYGVRCPTAIRA